MEDGKQMTEDGKQMTEDGKQMTEDGQRIYGYMYVARVFRPADYRPPTPELTTDN